MTSDKERVFLAIGSELCLLAWWRVARVGDRSGLMNRAKQRSWISISTGWLAVLAYHITLYNHPPEAGAEFLSLSRLTCCVCRSIKKRCTMADRAGVEMSDDDDYTHEEACRSRSLYGVVINHTT